MSKSAGIANILKSDSKCPRCQGLLIRDKFNYYFQWLTGTRCLNCGKIILDDKQRILNYVRKEKDNNRQYDELDLYKARRNDNKYSSYHIRKNKWGIMNGKET